MASIKLTRKINQTAIEQFRLRVWVAETSDNIPKELFLYQTIIPVPDQDVVDQYIGVCSYADMLNYPINVATDDTPYYRFGSVDLTFQSNVTLETKWDFIATSMEAFLNDLASAHTATPDITIYEFGT